MKKHPELKNFGLPGQVVLVLQGGGALGAYQVGCYEALHEAGIEPDWVIGTSIGALNGAIIAGNQPQERLTRLRDFWARVQHGSDWFGLGNAFPAFDAALSNFSTITRGIPAFFEPRLLPWGGVHAPLGVEAAAYYSTEPLRKTLSALVDFEFL